MVGGGAGTTGGLRARVAEGRPSWWVILAVSLALMALLVATAPAPHGRSQRVEGPGAPDQHPHAALRPGPVARPKRHGTPPQVPTTTSSTTTPSATPGPSLAAVHTTGTASSGATSSGGDGAAAPTPPSTAAPVAPASAGTAVPADRTQAQGTLDPPLTPSNTFAFTGSGATQISVVWSGSTYLTMDVSCPTGGQSVGGTGAMAATLPNASGSCSATVSEPASENVALTYTITIGPAGG